MKTTSNTAPSPMTRGALAGRRGLNPLRFWGGLALQKFSARFEAVPVTGSGYHLLTVWALDPVSGARSPETTAAVRIDCRAPSVIEARAGRGGFRRGVSVTMV